MKPITYFASLTPQAEGGYLVRFPDVPEALTEGETVEEATDQAEDALAVALDGYLRDDLDLPLATRIDAAEPVILVEIPLRPDVAALWLLRREMKRRKLTPSDVAGLIGRDEDAARRIVSGRGVRIDSTMKALDAIGIRPALAI